MIDRQPPAAALMRDRRCCCFGSSGCRPSRANRVVLQIKNCRKLFACVARVRADSDALE